MKRIFILSWCLLALLASANGAIAATLTVTSSTTWTALNPAADDTVIVKNNATLTINSTSANVADLQLGEDAPPNNTRGTGTITFSNATSALAVTNSFIMGKGSRAGNITMTNGGTLTVPAFTYNAGALTPGVGTVVLSATNTLPAAIVSFNNLTLSGGTTTLATNTVFTGTLTVSAGTLAVGSNTVTLNGPSVVGNNLNATAVSSLVFGGTSTGVVVPTNVTAINNLAVNNANGITLQNNLAFGGTLTLTSGAVGTGDFALVSTGPCANSISRPANGGHVNGNLTLTFPLAATTCTFNVGSGGAYTPIAVTKSLTANSGTLTGSATVSEHPEISNSGIDAAKDVNRYWSLTNDTINASSYGVTVTFISGDIDVGAATSNFVLGKFDGSTWSLPTPVTATGLTTGSTAVPGPLNNASFAAGEATFVCSVPSGLPSSMTCVCDNFGRASLNPSTIYGGNWAVSSSSGNFGSPRIANSGYLRLTDNSTNVSTSATMPGTFPAAGNLIVVEFRHFAYVGTGAGGSGGADGIALTLSDATVAPIPGAFGGSLGFAQKIGINGFAGGWVGIGIDEYGNYSTALEGRSGGGNALVPDSISVRGSGSGTTGYPFLSGTGSLSPGVDSPTSTTLAPGHAYRVSVDARCYQQNTAGAEITCNNASLAKRAQVSVNRDATGAGNFSAGNQIISFDAYAANASQANVPANWKLSFTASTGSQVNIHEVQGLKICAQTITPPAGYRIQVDNGTPSICGTPGGSPSSPIVTITALDTVGKTVTDYTKTINLSATLSGGGASNASWRKLGTATNITQYTFTPADQGTAQFYLSDTTAQTVFITASENGGTISSSYASGVQFSGTSSFNVVNNDALKTGPGGGVVAGRPHLFQVTKTNAGCGTDSTYSGVKSLDGWYTPAAGDHPTGADAPQICALNASNTCLPAPGGCQKLSIAEPTVSAGSNFMPPLSFTNGVASFCVATSDVGKYSVSLRDDTVATPIRGSSPMLTARPFAIIVSGLANNKASNATQGTGSLFTSAGSQFQATVGGYLWNAASDSNGAANGDGFPDTKDYATLVSGGLAAHYADTVTLSAGTPFFPPTSQDTPAGTGTAGSLNGGVLSITGGSLTKTDLDYSEVGSFTLRASPASAAANAAGYLNTPGLNLASRVVIFSNPEDLQNQNALVGRFNPARFKMTASSIVNRGEAACTPASAFTYMGEPVRVTFALQALSASNSPTRNYGKFPVGLTSYDYTQFFNDAVYSDAEVATRWTTSAASNSMGLWMVANGYAPIGATGCAVRFGQSSTWDTAYSCSSGGNPSSIAGNGAARVTVNTSPMPTMAWSNGVGTFTAYAVLQRAGAPDGPYETLNIGIDPRDADGVKLFAGDYNLDVDATLGYDHVTVGTTKMRFGRLRLANAFGTDRLNLPIGLSAEYWDGTSFKVNTDDSCTSLAGGSNGNFHLGYDTPSSLSVGNMPLSNVVFTNFTNGKGSLTLNKPTTSINGVKGSVTLCLNLADPDASCTGGGSVSAGMPWLQGNWGGATNWNADPFMRATFGVYKGGPMIYLREIH
jgi:MSHA biogenesis protein MshQ